MKVLDFGLAKVTEAPLPGADDETSVRTSEGVVLGTMPYMSPEQVEGREVDARSDVFSLGVVLHEAATGSRPFGGSSSAALVSAILRDPPPPIDARRDDLPGAFGRLIGKCLEKNRDRRIQTARDVRNEIDVIRRDIASGRDSPRPRPGPARVLRRRRLDASGDPRVPIDRRPALRQFESRCRQRVLQRRPDRGIDFRPGEGQRAPGDIAYVVDAVQGDHEGPADDRAGTRRAIRARGQRAEGGSSLRITAQLIDAVADTPLWSDKYSGSMDDIFEVQERVSREIVKALGVRLTSDEHRRLAARPIQDPRAFELYLQARQEIRRYAVPRALPLLEEAIRIEGETPPLVAMRAWATLWMVRLGMAKDQSPLEEADRAARSLLAEHPDAPYGYALLGNLEYERSRLGEALRNFERAVELEPNDNDSLVMMAFTLVGAGQHDRAIAMGPRMIECDPLSASTWMAAGGPLWFVGRVEEGLPIMRKGIELDPHNFVVRWTLGYACAVAGRVDEAKQHGAIIEGIFSGAAYTRQLLSLIDGLEGRGARGLERLAQINVGHGDVDRRQALERLRRATFEAVDERQQLPRIRRLREDAFDNRAVLLRFVEPARERARVAHGPAHHEIVGIEFEAFPHDRQALLDATDEPERPPAAIHVLADSGSHSIIRGAMAMRCLELPGPNQRERHHHERVVVVRLELDGSLEILSASPRRLRSYSRFPSSA